MQIARIKLLLWVTTAVAGTGAVAVIAAALATRLDASEDATNVSAPGASTGVNRSSAATSTDLPPLESFASAWELPLRRPLVDAPATPLAATDSVDQPVARLGVRLVGTIVDGKHARGIFLVGLNTVELKKIGESVGGAKVVSIETNTATLLFQGAPVVLHREKTPFDPTGESYEAAAAATAPEQ